MHIDIQSRDFPLTQAIRTHIERRLGFVLSTRQEQINRVFVRLYDVNGPKGGRDKCCLIQISLPRSSDVIVQDTESSMYDAINRATDRISRTISRRLTKQRNMAKQHLRDYRLNSSDYWNDSYPEDNQ